MATIQGVYVALFGRPADPTGLAYFNSVTKNGADLSGIGDLASTQEYKDRFAGQNNTQIVNSIYQSLFGRDAEAAGLNFFVDALNKGTLNVKNIAIAILDGAQGNDKTISGNKVAAADLYTKSLDTPTEIGSYTGNTAAAQGRAFISGVTTTVPTAAAVDTAVAAMVSAGNAGNTITLSAAADDTLSLTSGVVNGTATVFTTNRDDTIVATVAGSLTAADKIDGGLGVDTLRAVLPTTLDLNGAGGTANTNIQNVEKFVVEADAGGSALNVTNVSGLQSIVHDQGVDTTATAGTLTVTGVALTTSVGLAGAASASYTFKDADGSSDVANASLSAATGTLTLVGAETVNLANTGTSVATLTDVVAKTVAVTGAGDLSLTVTATATGLETVNAAGFGGKFTFDGTLNQALKTVTGGTGTDAITIDLNHTNDITINTGAGADIITVNGGGASATKALVLTGGADADQFVFQSVGNITATAAAATTNADFVKTLITVSDFDKAADAIKVTVTGAASVAAARDVLLTAEQSQISGASDLLAATKIAASYTSINSASTFQYGADTYIFVNNADAGATGTIDATDTLIKVTGVNVADLTSSNFQLSL